MQQLHEHTSTWACGGCTTQHNAEKSVVANILLQLLPRGFIASKEGGEGRQHPLTQLGTSLRGEIGVEQVQQLHKALCFPAV